MLLRGVGTSDTVVNSKYKKYKAHDVKCMVLGSSTLETVRVWRKNIPPRIGNDTQMDEWIGSPLAWTQKLDLVAAPKILMALNA